MNPGDYLRAIRSDGQATLDAASLGLDAPVPTTPGWTVGDVIVPPRTGSPPEGPHRARAPRRGEPPMVEPPAHRIPAGVVRRRVSTTSPRSSRWPTPPRRSTPGISPTRRLDSGSAGWPTRRSSTGSTPNWATGCTRRSMPSSGRTGSMRSSTSSWAATRTGRRSTARRWSSASRARDGHWRVRFGSWIGHLAQQRPGVHATVPGIEFDTRRLQAGRRHSGTGRRPRSLPVGPGQRRRPRRRRPSQRAPVPPRRRRRRDGLSPLPAPSLATRYRASSGRSSGR